MNRLHTRIAILEQAVPLWSGPAAWIVLDDGEDTAAGIARHEGVHGELGQRMAIVWRPVGDSAPCPA